MVSPHELQPHGGHPPIHAPNSPDTQVRSWFFGVQRDLSHNWLVDLSYVGNHGLNEILVNDINQATRGQQRDPLDLRPRPFDGGPASVPYPSSRHRRHPALGHFRLRRPASQGGKTVLPGTLPAELLHLVQGHRHCRRRPSTAAATATTAATAFPQCRISTTGRPTAASPRTTTPLSTPPLWCGRCPSARASGCYPTPTASWMHIVGGWQTTGIVSGRSGDPLDFAYNPNNDAGGFAAHQCRRPQLLPAQPDRACRGPASHHRPRRLSAIPQRRQLPEPRFGVRRPAAPYSILSATCRGIRFADTTTGMSTWA